MGVPELDKAYHGLGDPSDRCEKMAILGKAKHLRARRLFLRAIEVPPARRLRHELAVAGSRQ